MRDKRSRPPWVNDPSVAERAIVLQVLRDDHDARWSLAELEAEAFDVVPSALTGALADLERHGAVVRCDDGYVASRCAWHLRLFWLRHKPRPWANPICVRAYEAAYFLRRKVALRRPLDPFGYCGPNLLQFVWESLRTVKDIVCHGILVPFIPSRDEKDDAPKGENAVIASRGQQLDS